MRKLLGTALLVMLSLAAGLGAAELAFRWLGHRFATNGEWFAAGRIVSDADPVLGFSLTPAGTELSVRGGAYTWRVRTNAHGQHDVEHSLAKPEGVRRLLLLGDSFLYGPGVPLEQNVARRLESLLPGTEVLNAGVPGYTLAQQYLYYVDRGHRFNPDQVLLLFFMNDLEPERGLEADEGPDGLPRAFRWKRGRVSGAGDTGPSGPVTAISEWIRERSLLYVFVRKRLRRLGADAPRGPVETHEARRERTPELAAFADPDSDEAARAAWERGRRLLDALKERTARDGASFCIVMVPAPFQLSERRWEEWTSWLGLPNGTLRRDGPQRMLAGWCAATGSPCLDLLAPFAGGGGEDLYIPHDLHWTAEGHALAARLVADFIRSGAAGASPPLEPPPAVP